MRFNDFSNILKTPQVSLFFYISSDELKVRRYKNDALMAGASIRDISDEEVLDIMQKIISTFQEVGKQKGEKSYHEFLETGVSKYQDSGFLNSSKKW